VLENFAGGEIADELQIGVEEVVVGEFGAVTHCTSRKIGFQCPLVFRNREKAQFNRAARPVNVLNAGHLVADAGVDSISSSSSRRRASRGCSPVSILPPGNSHFSGMGWCWRALANEELAVAQDERSYHLPDPACHFAHEVLPYMSGIATRT